MRRTVGLAVVACFLLPAIAVLFAARMHPTTTANITLSTQKLAFVTDTRRILSPDDNEQLIVTGIDLLELPSAQGTPIVVDGKRITISTLKISGEPGTSCRFYRVRSSAFELSGPAMITLEASARSSKAGHAAWFSLKSHGAMKATITSRQQAGSSRPEFACDRVHVNGGPLVDTIEATLTVGGGDLMLLNTSSDCRLDFQVAPNSEIGDSQIPIRSELRFSEIDPDTADEKAVLLRPPSGSTNEVLFDDVDRKVALDDADLLVVSPDKHFYLRHFRIKDGIQVSMHGVVRDVQVGAGPDAMESHMPSLFDHMDTEKRLWLAVPAIAGTFLGFLEKMGLLRSK
jgi:hypothetical protein